MKVVITYTDGTKKIENANDFTQALQINTQYTKKAQKDRNILSITYED